MPYYHLLALQSDQDGRFQGDQRSWTFASAKLRDHYNLVCGEKLKMFHGHCNARSNRDTYHSVPSRVSLGCAVPPMVVRDAKHYAPRIVKGSGSQANHCKPQKEAAESRVRERRKAYDHC